MVHMPSVNPGDHVAWHCDTIHSVDEIHAGKSDSSVLYIPACPMIEDNANHLARQRDAFIKGTPSPDIGGGVGENDHVGRPLPEEMPNLVGDEGYRAMGLKEWDTSASALNP
jgi:hypothetical protein